MWDDEIQGGAISVPHVDVDVNGSPRLASIGQRRRRNTAAPRQAHEKRHLRRGVRVREADLPGRQRRLELGRHRRVLDRERALGRTSSVTVAHVAPAGGTTKRRSMWPGVKGTAS